MFSRFKCVVGVVALAVLAISGCATSYVSNMDGRDGSFYYTPVLEDKLIGIGKIVRATGNGSAAGTESLVFLGEKKSYLLVRGGDEILSLAQSSIGPDLEIRTKVNDSSDRLYFQDGKFWGTVFVTTLPAKTYSPDQIVMLEKSGFVRKKADSSEIFRKEIVIEGGTFDPVKLPPETSSTLSRVRPIAFYPSANAEAPVNIKKILFLPGALTVDAVTLPVQVLGIGAIWILIEASGGLKIM